jgi:hypothetical protein
MVDESAPLHTLVRRWAEAFNDRDADTLVELADPEVDWYPLQISARGHFTGPEGLRRWISELTSADPGHRIRTDSVRTLSDDRVLLVGEICLDDDPVSPYTLLLVARAGKVLTARSYLSSEDTLERLGLIDP